jgi:hypothetical protein
LNNNKLFDIRLKPIRLNEKIISFPTCAKVIGLTVDE